MLCVVYKLLKIGKIASCQDTLNIIGKKLFSKHSDAVEFLIVIDFCVIVNITINFIAQNINCFIATLRHGFKPFIFV